MQNLSTVAFKREFVDKFPGDHSGNLTPRQTPGVLYSKALPTPVAAPRLIGWSDELAQELGIARPADKADLDILGGNTVTESMYPYAACYAGHQFGNWAGQLGDGRAITLGEMTDTKGNTRELQLKGAGLTPYSRHADGRAVLRSSVREYLMSEAMYHLGVPTTRALSLVATGERVMRDMFYDGHPEYEPGAIVLRVAPTFIRFGNFEILAARKEIDHLQQLVDWTINRYYPHIKGEDRVVRWFAEITERTAAMVAEWARVGFVHGVMNTDNMSILGVTIDYGPYSMVDDFDLNFTPNTTDLPGRRYAFGRQAPVAQWNLSCLAGAILPLLQGKEQLVEILESYPDTYWKHYYQMMQRKLGLDKLVEDDTKLIHELEKVLGVVKADMTIFFQLLIGMPGEFNNKEDVVNYFEPCLYSTPVAIAAEQFSNWVSRYQARLKQNNGGRDELINIMKATSPRFVLRNYLLHQAIEELEQGNDVLFRKLELAIKTPYSNQHDEYFIRRPDWAAQKAGCSMLSCSS